LFPQTIEKELVQDHRIHGDELLALEPVEQKAGSIGIIELCELLIDEVQALYGAAIVVFIVADDKPLRHAFDPRWIASERLHGVKHQFSP
jgi:hypothetical protein